MAQSTVLRSRKRRCAFLRRAQIPLLLWPLRSTINLNLNLAGARIAEL